MPKVFLTICTLVATFTAFSICADAQFDANYYATKYPDVVDVVGDSPEALYNHYITFGQSEGRYESQSEETYYFENGVTKQKSNSSVDQITITQPPSSTSAISPLTGYSTYVDVDIDKQTVTYFENGEVKLQTSCVTGSVETNHETPKGEYSIITKVTGKYLVGTTWKCWVDRWMQFTNSHIGFHDASWRSSFGETIYQTDGSHGCVNLPKEAAYSLYDFVSIGTIVVVH